MKSAHPSNPPDTDNPTIDSKDDPSGTSDKITIGPRGLNIERMFTRRNIHPFDELEWELRNASITNESGEIFFEESGVEFPKNWSQMATNVVTSKYFSGALGSVKREKSVRRLVERVSRTIADWGAGTGYFEGDSGEIFYHELSHLLVNQKAAFNSPVWFNCGVKDNSNQFSACFINSVEDTMESILNLVKTEGMLFKWGSGTGTNLSTLRSSREALGGGGTASGPVSFMKGYDAFAGVIKSGGKTRRAAKMVILDVDHPDIKDFILCKANEEKKAWSLIDAGYDGSFNGEAYSSIAFQNANHSVRVSDNFMESVMSDKSWQTRSVARHDPMDTYSSKKMLMDMSEATHICGDPGIQFDTTINHWHTCPHSGRIEASNPCSEYMFLNDSACNLSSLNLMKFRNEDGTFDTQGFLYAVGIMIIAQEILVENASYPTPKIAKNSVDFRPLGLGYANLGALLMAHAFPYDSLEGRNYGALLTALMTGGAYKISSMIAAIKSPFKYYPKNKDSMLRVIQQHKDAVEKITSVNKDSNSYDENQGLADRARKVWQEAYDLGRQYGYKNSQVTVLAPTGTIGFMMDCDTTGVEPDIALVKYKKLVGGGLLKIVNQTIPLALEKLGYSKEQSNRIIEYIDENATIEGCGDLDEDHLPIFDCAFKATNGTRSIHYMGHIKMMEVVQPFLSGAISKTVNMPNEITTKEIYEAYVEAWKRGLKSIAIYRDGSKRTQPLSTQKEDSKEQPIKGVLRRRLPDERKSITHKFSVGGHEGYITVGMYEDGSLGEIFIVMSKEGTVVSGLMDSFATAISLALQYGVPLKVLTNKFSHTRFEPSGWTNNKQIPMAKSIMDYIFRWLSLKFPQESLSQESDPLLEPEYTVAVDQKAYEKQDIQKYEQQVFKNQSDATPCSTCGSIMVRNGSCYRCLNCGNTSGCS